MKQKLAKAALESYWGKWWHENREAQRGRESTADLDCVSDFLREHPQYLNFRATIGARGQLELWADQLRRNAIIAENARLNK